MPELAFRIPTLGGLIGTLLVAAAAACGLTVGLAAQRTDVFVETVRAFLNERR